MHPAYQQIIGLGKEAIPCVRVSGPRCIKMVIVAAKKFLFIILKAGREKYFKS